MFNTFFGGSFRGETFEAYYRAMPVAFIEKSQAEFGDKVILPASALDRLASLHVQYPMLFRVENLNSGRFTHCGVLEFTAEEGVVYLPHWMMQNLLLEVGETVKFKNVSLEKGTYVKLQPVTSDFLDISNPKAVLERSLRSYTCLTVGDCFVINYNNRNYEIEVREARPQNAISVVETDCQVDFEAPKDYKEPERILPPAPAPPQPVATPQADAKPTEEEDSGPKFTAFVGSGKRLDGKPASSTPIPAPQPAPPTASSSSAPAPVAKAGTFVSTGNRLLDKLERDRLAAGQPPSTAAPPRAADPPAPKEDKSSFKAFSGKGYTLK